MKKSSYHFVGIGGMGMSALARILLQRGLSVSGSDVALSSAVEQLIDLGAQVFIGHAADHIDQPDALILSTAIADTNPEIQRAKERGIPLMHRSAMLKMLMEGYKPLLVSGTHGKTTTSSLLAYLLVYAGYDPGYAIGGTVSSLNANGGHGQGAYFVAEADESDGSFLEYAPFGAIITNSDGDHLDYWKTLHQLNAGFKTFALSVASLSHLLWCGDDPVLSGLGLPGCSYGFEPHNRARVSHFRQGSWRSVFDLAFCGKDYLSVEVSLIGAHNALNAAAVFVMGLQLGIPEEKIRQALLLFQGVHRRAEIKGQSKGVTVLDDYAHHPTEVVATLRALKQTLGERRLVVAFQPHRYTRTRDCLEAWSRAFLQADILVLTDIYAASEAPIEGIDAHCVLAKIQESSSFLDTRYCARSELAAELVSILQPSDVLVTMGAGDITQVGRDVLRGLNAQELT